MREAAERRGQVHLHQLAEDRLGRRFERALEHDRRGGDEQVDAAAEERERLLDAFVALRAVGRVGAYERAVGGRRDDDAAVAVAAGEGDLHAGGSELLDDRAADARRAAGDEGGAAGQLRAARSRAPCSARRAARMPPSTVSEVPVEKLASGATRKNATAPATSAGVAIQPVRVA